MPKKSNKHDEIDLDKVNKILVETNIDPKKVSQWNIEEKKYYSSANSVLQEKIRHLFYKYNNAKSKGEEKALEEDKIPDYRSDKDIRKETNTEKSETEILSESFFPLASTPASSDLKKSINSNKSQQLKKPQVPENLNPFKNKSAKTEETSLPISHTNVKKTQIPSSNS